MATPVKARRLSRQWCVEVLAGHVLLQQPQALSSSEEFLAPPFFFPDFSQKGPPKPENPQGVKTMEFQDLSLKGKRLFLEVRGGGGRAKRFP